MYNMIAVQTSYVRQWSFGNQNKKLVSQSPQNPHSWKHMVPEEKRKRNGRLNGSLELNLPKLATPEEKRKKNGSVNGSSALNAGPGRKTEEKRKGKRKKAISVQMENIVICLEELSVYRACTAYWQTVSSRMDYWVAAGTVDLIVGPMTGNISFCTTQHLFGSMLE